MARKRKTLPKDFREICEGGDLAELVEVYQKCELEAYTGYGKSTAYSTFGIPESFIQWLVNEGADINAVNTYQRTALMEHASYWKSNLAALIKAGADVNRVDYQGDTALHFAAAGGKVAAVRLLLEAGAEVQAENKQGQSPLEKGLVRCTNAAITEVAEIAELLVAAGTKKTEKMQAAVTTIGKNYEFHRSHFNPDSLAATDSALQRLYQLFEVIPVQRRQEYDGASPIKVTSETWQKQHQELWELLVPGRGSCQNVQGEVIRITGKVSDEIFRNGGGNWDREFAKMTKALVPYFKMGNPLSPELLQETEALIKVIIKADGEEGLARITELSVEWVKLNSTPIVLETPSYKR